MEFRPTVFLRLFEYNLLTPLKFAICSRLRRVSGSIAVWWRPSRKMAVGQVDVKRPTRRCARRRCPDVIWEVAHASGRLTGHSETLRRAGLPARERCRYRALTSREERPPPSPGTGGIHLYGLATYQAGGHHVAGLRETCDCRNVGNMRGFARRMCTTIRRSLLIKRWLLPVAGKTHRIIGPGPHLDV